ncbi:hypothetical protein [Bacillus cereus]|uniref:hypothetical protein n=1 Tax=Bacillus cereus TaxID=1396 RepID=UPI0020D26634|nr:hypothetical protein [Bacillus cereus]
MNYDGQIYVVQKLFAVVFNQSLSNKIDTIRQDIDDLKNSTELVKKYSERYKKAKETKNDDVALVESSELAQSVFQLLTTLKKSELKNTVDKIYEKEADPVVREKYNSTIATLEMMNQDSGNIIQQIQNGKNLAQQDKIKLQNYANDMTAYKKQLVEWYADTLTAVTDLTVSLIDQTSLYWLTINDTFVEPAEKWVGILAKDEISKFADGVRDYGQQVTAMHEGFKSRLPEYKQMASDLRVVNHWPFVWRFCTKSWCITS